MYTLGATFLKFRRLLNLKLPIIDPSLYIHRFASKLELGEHAHNVGLQAIRIVQARESVFPLPAERALSDGDIAEFDKLVRTGEPSNSIPPWSPFSPSLLLRAFRSPPPPPPSSSSSSSARSTVVLSLRESTRPSREI